MLWFLVLLLMQTFDWIVVGKNGALHPTRERAFDFEYTVGDGVAVAALPLKGTPLAQMGLLRFSMKTDVPTVVAVLLNEKKPGGDYTAICWSTGNTWQKVELTPADFHLNSGLKDPPDPDGKLDLDAVASIGILDLNSVFGVNVDTNSPIFMESHGGKHSFSIDEFEVAPAGAAAGAVPGVIDSFASPQLQWITRGGAELKPEAQGMRAVYRQMDGKSVLLSHPLGSAANLTGKDFLAFEVSSERPAQLLMTFEELSPGKPQGPRYNAIVEVAGGGKVSHREIDLGAFEHGEDSPADANGMLDWSRLKSFSILDITASDTHEMATNSLWIGNIRGVSDGAKK